MAFQGTGIIPGWLLADETYSKNSKLVYVALTTFIDSKTKDCFPSHAAIGERCALSVSSVQRGLDELREKGVVTWRQRARKDSGQTSNHYVLRMQ